MKYYIGQLWKDINSDDAQLRTFANTQWEQNDRMYTAYFQRIRLLLPQAALKEFEQNEFFHDWEIQKIVISVSEASIEIVLRYEDTFRRICLEGVENIGAYTSIGNAFIGAEFGNAWCCRKGCNPQ